MAGLLNTSSVLLCPHGGTVSIVSANARVRAAGGYLARPSDVFLIVGCPFSPGAPHPCAQVQWVLPALQSQAVSDATLTEESVGLCVAADGAVQGPVQVAFTQARVAGR